MKKILVVIIFVLAFGQILTAQTNHLWVTASYGGANGYGTILEADSTGTNFHVVASFNQTNGSYPQGSLVMGSNGKIFGATRRGGYSNSCVLFKFDTATHAITNLYDFMQYPTHGDIPYSGLISDTSNCLFYGMANSGGANGQGAIYSFNPATYQYTDIYNFISASGGKPYGELIKLNDGKFYGMTGSGGAHGSGVIFSYDPINNVYADLHDFTILSGDNPAYGNLIQANDGKLYGMTESGGSFAGAAGVIFSFDPITNSYSDLHDFSFSSGGYDPFGSLMQASDGKLYGMTLVGGANNLGVLFSYDITTNTYTNILDFDGANNGAKPQRGLKEVSTGKLFGLTMYGGIHDAGTIFSYDFTTSTYTKLLDFDSATTGTNPTCEIFVSDNQTNPCSTTTNSTLCQWTQKPDFNGGGYRYGAIGFSIGDKGYIGTGRRHPNVLCRDFWEWDQSTNVWTQMADYPGSHVYYALGFSIGTKGYICTGDSGLVNHNQFYEYDQITNTWIQKADFPGVATKCAVGFSIGNKGYVGTGQDLINNAFTNEFWEWDQASNTWIQKANFPGTARFLATGFSIGNKGYIGTGRDFSNNYYNDFWEWDQVANTWTQKANLPGVPRISATGFSIGINGYIGTGQYGFPLSDFWEWNQLTNIWTQRAAVGATGRTDAIGFSIGNKGYIGTGGNNQLWEFTQCCTPPPSPSITPSGTTTFCHGDSVTLTSDAATTYLWSNGSTSQSISVHNSGNYGVTITDSSHCGATSPITTISVTTVDTSVSMNANILASNAINATYQWIACNNANSPITGATNQTYTVTSNGDYAVIVTQNGCTDTSSCYLFFSVNDKDITTHQSISLNPNPFTTQATLTLHGSFHNPTLFIYNLLGQEINSINFGTNSQVTITNMQFPSGMYFYILKENNKDILRIGKMIVE